MTDEQNPNQAVQPGAEDTGDEQTQQTQPAAQASSGQTNSSGEESFPIRLVKQETGETHWNVAKGVYELIRHAETGEPTSEYRLLATIDGVDVVLQAYNAGGVETLVRAGKQTQQQQSGS